MERDSDSDLHPHPSVEHAWSIIANAYDGNWDLATPEWREAAIRWRDAWLPSLPVPSPRPDDPPRVGAAA